MATCIGVDLAAVYRRRLAHNQTRLGATVHDLLEYGADEIAVA